MISTISSTVEPAPSAASTPSTAREHGETQDHGVDRGGDESRTQTRQRVVELDPLGCPDRDPILILHAVNLEAFVRSRQGAWTELDGLLRRARGRPERLGPDGVLRLGELYRGAVADLARGRRSSPTDPAVRALEELVNRARATIYVVPPRKARSGAT